MNFSLFSDPIKTFLRVEKSAKNIVVYSDSGYATVNQLLQEKKYSKIFILVDSNTHSHCLAPFLQKIHSGITPEIIEMEPGEESKTLDTCEGIWNSLTDLEADRKSLLINLGGGVVTDLGGFVAAAYKRGIAWVQVPTTLLAMVDAAIGGKNGVNLGVLKNQIGFIQEPEQVLIDPSFLATLPAAEMRSGLAEMLKHGLIQDPSYWQKLVQLEKMDSADLPGLIRTSVEIKQNIVESDPRENGMRKSLNFGHTLGHAIESYFLKAAGSSRLLHGEAVAIGMVLAAYLSEKVQGFPGRKRDEIRRVIHDLYGIIPIEKNQQEEIISLLKFDKKNVGGRINFVLLRRIGEPALDQEIPEPLIYEAFEYYLKQR